MNRSPFLLTLLNRPGWDPTLRRAREDRVCWWQFYRFLRVQFLYDHKATNVTRLCTISAFGKCENFAHNWQHAQKMSKYLETLSIQHRCTGWLNTIWQDCVHRNVRLCWKRQSTTPGLLLSALFLPVQLTGCLWAARNCRLVEQARCVP